jgi:hypothetical protein
MSHLTSEEIDAFLIGAPVSDPKAFRRHVAECEPCARELASRARGEESFERAAAHAATRRPKRARVVWAAAAGLVLCVGAGAAMRFGFQSSEVAPPAATGNSTMNLGAECISPAQVCLHPADTDTI